MALQRGEYAQGLAHLQDSERMLESSNDLLRRALLLNWLGISAMNMGNPQEAERLLAESRQMALALHAAWGATLALSVIAESLVAQGRLGEAEATAAEAATIFRDLRDPYGIGRMETVRASVEWLRGDCDTAHRHAAEAVSLARQVTEPYNLSRTLTLYGIILVDEARYEEADTLLTEGLFSWRLLGNRGGMTVALAGLTAAAAGQGQVERARRLSVSEPLRRRDQGVLVDGVLDRRFEHFMTCIREQLGDLPDDVPEISLEAAVDLALAA
jgi:tetratricopeptide (TPR) repeat protein